MNELLKSALKQTTPFKEEDFEIKNDIKAMMATKGWEHLTKKIWPDLFQMLRKRAYARNLSEASAKSLLGAMEGHEVTVDIAKQFVDMAEEREIILEQQKEKEERMISEVDLEALTNGTHGR